MYNEQSATPEQRKIIHSLVKAGNPAKGCPHRFAWLEEFVDWPDGKTFGYFMPLIDTKRYVSMAEIESKRIAHPGYGIMVEACRQLAECLRELHIGGYCYRDISKKNFLLNPDSGDVMICDNDNIIIDRQDIGNIKGTTSFVAPEVILNTAKPSTVTDLHSLAVLFFHLLCGGHPLHGKKERETKVLDVISSRKLYGLDPVFIFDPKNRSNRLPDEKGYRHVAKQWKVLPVHIRNLFLKAFTSGLKNPSERVTDIEWKNALTQMQDLHHVCACGAENFWDPLLHQQSNCWHCSREVKYPPKLYAKGKSVQAMLVISGRRVSTLHFGDKSGYHAVGEMEENLQDQSFVMLRNKSKETWKATLGDQKADVIPNLSIPLVPGLVIKAGVNELLVYP